MGQVVELELEPLGKDTTVQLVVLAVLSMVAEGAVAVRVRLE
jgi:hypothetical protein